MSAVAEELEILEPSGGEKVTRREWTISDEFEDGTSFERTYTQKPLSYFAKLEFFGLLAQGIDRAMNSGLTVDGMLDSAGQVRQVQGQSIGDIDSFVKGLATIAQYLPGMMEEAYCIWLNVPKTERPWVKDVWSRPSEEGGLSDDDGIAILETFLDDNLEELKSFFSNRLMGVAKKVSGTFSSEGDGASPPQKRSKRTRVTTPKE